MTREALDIIIRPLLTEKLTDMRETQRKIGLLVRADANKVEIKKATERALNVKVEKVSVMNVGGKVRRLGRMVGKKSDWKKAIVTLKPGEKRTVEFTITPDTLSMLDTEMHRVVEPGVFEIMVGPSPDQTKTVLLTVAGNQGETGISSVVAAPAGAQSATVSNFDDLKVSSAYGGWMVTSDAQMGGNFSLSLLRMV